MEIKKFNDIEKVLEDWKLEENFIKFWNFFEVKKKVESILVEAEKALQQTEEYKNLKKILSFSEKLEELNKEFLRVINLEVWFYLEVEEFCKKKLKWEPLPEIDYLDKLHSYLYYISNWKRIYFDPKDYQFWYEDLSPDEVYEKYKKLQKYLDDKVLDVEIELLRRDWLNIDWFTTHEKKVIADLKKNNIDLYRKFILSLKIDFWKDEITFNDMSFLFKISTITRGEWMSKTLLEKVQEVIWEKYAKDLFKEEIENWLDF